MLWYTNYGDVQLSRYPITHNVRSAQQRGHNQLSDALQAIPDRMVPAYLAGNLGEVIMLASLVATEIGLRSAGL